MENITYMVKVMVGDSKVRKWRAKVRQMVPKESQKIAKGSQKATRRKPKGAKGLPKCIQKSIFGKGRENDAKTVRPSSGFGILLVSFSIKNALKNQRKNRCRKSMRKYEKMLPK